MTLYQYILYSLGHQYVMTSDETNLLLSLGLTDALIKDSGPQENLTATLTWINNNRPETLINLGVRKANIVLSAAASGILEVLEWAKIHAPDLLNGSDSYGAKLAHYAVVAKDPNVLTWVETHTPKLLRHLDQYGSNIAHNAAFSDDPNRLSRMERDYRSLLLRRNSHGANVSHYAALAGKINNLRWIEDNYSELLPLLDDKGFDLVHYATRSNSPRVLKHVLQLVNRSDRIDVSQLQTDAQANVFIDFLEQEQKSGRTSVTHIKGSKSPEVSEKTFQVLQNTVQKSPKGTNVGYDPKRNFFPITDDKENRPNYNSQIACDY